MESKEIFTMKQARRLKDLKQDEVAKHMKIHVQTYRNLENHSEKCTIEQAHTFAEFVGRDIDEINFAADSTLSSN